MSTANLAKKFDFTIALTQKVVRDLRIRIVHAGDLHLKGTVTRDLRYDDDESDYGCKYNVDFDSITWNGGEVLDLLEIADAKCCPLLDECYDAVYAHADYLFAKQINAA